jgi:hypothetical protein
MVNCPKDVLGSNYERPLLTTRFTLERFGRRVPGRRLSEMTRSGAPRVGRPGVRFARLLEAADRGRDRQADVEAAPVASTDIHGLGPPL